MFSKGDGQISVNGCVNGCRQDSGRACLKKRWLLKLQSMRAIQVECSGRGELLGRQGKRKNAACEGAEGSQNI
jgi:hypothetical protein